MTTKVIRNIILGILLILMILAVLIYTQLDNIIKYNYLSNSDKIIEVSEVVSIHKSRRLKDYNLDSKEIEYIKIAIPIVDSFLNIRKKIGFDILIDSGDCSGVTNPISNLIRLKDCKEYYLPFVHEYLHLVFGIYKELWFSEGLATYLSLLITSESSLKNYNDQNTAYFFDAWYKDVYSNIDWNKRVELTYIDDLKLKYNRTEIDSIIHFDRELSFNRLNNPVEFYRLSASLCAFLCENIGKENVLNLARKRTASNNSILELALEKNISFEELYKNWLLSFRQK